MGELVTWCARLDSRTYFILSVCCRMVLCCHGRWKRLEGILETPRWSGQLKQPAGRHRQHYSEHSWAETDGSLLIRSDFSLWRTNEVSFWSYGTSRYFIIQCCSLDIELFSLSFRTPIPFMLPFAVLPSAIYMLSNEANKPALITDILGLSFAYNALCLLKLDSFRTGTILLAGLFLYDIWWVFGTEVVSTIQW